MESLKNLFSVSDLRNRVLFTLAILGIHLVDRVDHAALGNDVLVELELVDELLELRPREQELLQSNADVARSVGGVVMP